MSEPLVSMRSLAVTFVTSAGPVAAVRDVSLEVRAGECLAVVGESGSGKSVTARTLLGLAGRGARVAAEQLEFDGTDLRRLGAREWRALRGRRIGFVLQDALTSLDPLRRVGDEVQEALEVHGLASGEALEAKALALLAEVGVPEPELRARQYPYELSGGLRQRALIASAIAADPAFVIADEPTTALDVTVQAQVLDLLAARKDAGTALLLVSHDLAVVARIADRIAVMHDGRIVEEGPTRQVLDDPVHPYTRALLAAVPRLERRSRRAAVQLDPTAPIVLRAERLSKGFRTPNRSWRKAVDEISFELRAGEALGIVGESGSGKTTAAQLVLALLAPDQGAVTLAGEPWSALRERDRRLRRPRIQLVQQDPLSAFDPRFTVERIVGEALTVARRDRTATRERVCELIAEVGLSADLLGRRPLELSGGQRQRVAIARALASKPDVLVCDEPVSALDVSIQAQILALLARLRNERGLALLLISHDLAVVNEVCDRVAVMKDGRIVEAGDVDTVLHAPAHEYTRALLRAVPSVAALPDEEEQGVLGAARAG